MTTRLHLLLLGFDSTRIPTTFTRALFLREWRGRSPSLEVDCPGAATDLLGLLLSSLMKGSEGDQESVTEP